MRHLVDLSCAVLCYFFVSNKPIGDNARKGAVRKRSQLKVKVEGEDRWTRGPGAFMAD
jgi:hypothetical protein